MTDKKSFTTVKICEISISKKKNKQWQFNSANTENRDLSSWKVRINEENHAFFMFSEIAENYWESLSSVFNIYKKFTHLFQEEKSVKALFKYQTWNHKIQFESEK